MCRRVMDRAREVRTMNLVRGDRAVRGSRAKGVRNLVKKHGSFTTEEVLGFSDSSHKMIILSATTELPAPL